MAKSTIQTIDELLAGAAESVTDEETLYNINSARQLLAVVEQDYDDIEDIAARVDDAELLDRLRDHGYVDADASDS
jgi:hypothetical protein